MSKFKIIVLFAIFTIIGMLLVPHFPIDLNPTNALPKLLVSYSLPYSSPETMEQEVTSILENVLSQISSIKRIYSVSSYNEGSIEITFDKEVDINFKKFEVASRIRQIYPKLNPQTAYPTVEQRGRDNENRKPILIYQINSALAPFIIKRTIADLLAPALSQLHGVNDIHINGARDLQLNIDYDYEKLKILNLSKDQISKSIQRQFSFYYPGVIISNSQNLNVRVGNEIENIGQVEDIVVKSAGSEVTLKNIADVYIEESQPQNIFRVNGLNSVSLAIYADDNINRIDLANRLKSSVSELVNSLPKDYALELEYDDTAFLTKEIKKNYTRLLLSISLLFGFVFIFYRNWKHIVILLIGIGATVFTTSFAAYLLGIRIHLYTIAGVTLALGVVVDNLIMVLDHIQHKRYENIFVLLLGGTLINVSALLTILLLPEEERQNLTDFSIIVSIMFLCSLFVSIFLVPAVFSTFSNKTAIPPTQSIPANYSPAQSRYLRVISTTAKYKKSLIALVIFAFGIPIFLLPASIENVNWYNNTVGSELYQEKIKPYSDKIFGGTLRFFFQNVFENSQSRDIQRTQLNVFAELPSGSTLEEMNSIVQHVERYLEQVQGVEKFVAEIYSGQLAKITILFLPKYEKTSFPYQLKTNLIAMSLNLNGVDWNIVGVGQGFSNSRYESLPRFRVEMKGYNYDELAMQAQKLSDKLLLHKRIEKTNLNERLNLSEKPAEELFLNLTSGGFLYSGVELKAITTDVLQKSNVNSPDFYTSIKGNTMPVVIKSKDASNFSSFNVLNDAVFTNNGGLTVSDISTLSLQKETNSIHKEDRQYIRVVSFEYLGTYKLGNDYLQKILNEMIYEMPVGYSIKKLNTDWSWGDAKHHYALLGILLMLIFLISAILFENILAGIYLMLIVPISFIGVFLAFALVDSHFDQGAYASFILIAGLTVNASIFIIYLSLNSNSNTIMLEKIFAKFRPVGLSLLSSCLGFIPFLTGGRDEIFWFSLAVGCIGGLLTTFLIVFFFLPVFLFKKN